MQTADLQTRAWVSQTRTSVSQTSASVSQTSTPVSQNSTSVRLFRLDGICNTIYNLPLCSLHMSHTVYAHTLATAVIMCRRDMYPQGVALREFFVPNDFTPMFCHCNMSRQSSFARTSYSSGACDCNCTTDQFNQLQTAKKKRNKNFMLTYLL